jgi:hypothetical protein
VEKFIGIYLNNKRLSKISLSLYRYNTLCRVTPIESEFIPQYDKEKYKEMILDTAEIVLGYFGFDRTALILKKEEERHGMKIYGNRGLETYRLR